MLLSDSLVCALDSYDVSGIKVFCDQSKREEISNYFIEKYNVLWSEALTKTEEKYGNCVKSELITIAHQDDIYDYDYAKRRNINEICCIKCS